METRETNQALGGTGSPGICPESIHTQIHIHVCTYAHVHGRIHIRTRTYAYEYLHTHTYAHTHTHTQAHIKSCWSHIYTDVRKHA